MDGKLVGSTPVKIELRDDTSTVSVRSTTGEPGSSTSSRFEPAIKLRAGYIPLTANLPFFVALERGHFERRGLDVQAIEATSPNDIVTGLAAGELDFAGVLAYPIIFPAALRYPDTFVLYASCEETRDHFTSSIIVKKDSSTRRAAELRGKRVGVYTGLVQINFLKAILVSLGMQPSDVEIVEISPRLQIQGLISDQYDALSSTEPTVNIAKIQGIARAIIENPRVRILSPFPSAATVLPRTLVDERPEVAAAIAQAFDDAVDFINEHPDEAKRALLKYTPIPKDIEQAVLADLKLFRYCKLGEENRLNVQRFADFMFDNGIMKERMADVNTLFGDYEPAPRD